MLYEINPETFVQMVALGINREAVREEFDRICGLVESCKRDLPLELNLEEPNIHLQFHQGVWSLWDGISDYIRDHRGVFGVGFLDKDSEVTELVESLISEAFSLSGDFSLDIKEEPKLPSLGIASREVTACALLKESLKTKGPKLSCVGVLNFEGILIDIYSTTDRWVRDSFRGSQAEQQGLEIFTVRLEGFVGHKAIQVLLDISIKNDILSILQAIPYLD